MPDTQQIKKLTRAEKREIEFNRYREAKQQYMDDQPYFNWLGKRDFAWAVIELTRLEHKRHFSSIHEQEYIWALDCFHADYDTPRILFEENRWASYQEYLDWKKANPEPLTAEMAQIKKTYDLLEACGLDHEALMSMSPEYLKAFKYMRDNAGKGLVGFNTDEELDAWTDLVMRKLERDPKYQESQKKHREEMELLDEKYKEEDK